jgi:hypothetical protein
MLDTTSKRASLDLDFRPKIKAILSAVCKHRNRPLSYKLTSLSLTPERVCISVCGSPTTIGHKATPLLRHHG